MEDNKIMNSHARKEFNRLLKSKDKYKKLSIKRNRDTRLLKLRLKEVKCSRNKYKNIAEKSNIKVEELLKENKSLKEVINNSQHLIKEYADKKYFLQYISLQLIIRYMISFRSASRILKTPLATNSGIKKSPHFTTIREWCLRLGFYLLNNVKKIEDKWVCIVDFTVQIGKAKALIMLRLPYKNIKSNKAIEQTDVEVIGLKVGDSFKGAL